MKKTRSYKNYTVTSESKIVCGADWQEQLAKTGRAGHEVTVTTVILHHGNFDEVILAADPRFMEAVNGCDLGK